MTKKVVKLAVQLLIILILNSYKVYSQTPTDTTLFKKDFEKLLSKYHINSIGYLINVTSNNQSGGQTAFVITNNYYGDSVLDAKNFKYTLIGDSNQKVLTVAPRKGIWVSPFVATDSAKSRIHFFDPGSGMVSFIHGIMACIDDIDYPIEGAGRDGASSKLFPLVIYLHPNDPSQFYIFGDLQDSHKWYLYYKGEVSWFPLMDDD